MTSKKVKVVIVDDEKNIRDGLKLLIPWEKFGCEIADTAQNGIEALELCRHEAIDIIVTDIKMPMMDGLELAKNIAEKYPWIFIVITSAYRDFSYAQTAIQYKVNSYLVKPIDEVKLSSEISKIVFKIKKNHENERRENIVKLFYLSIYSAMNNYSRKAVHKIVEELGLDFDEIEAASVQIRFREAIEDKNEIISCFHEIHNGIYDIDNSGNIIFLVTAQNSFADVISKIGELKHRLDEKINNNIYIAIGSHAKAAEELYGSYISTNNVFFTNMIDNSSQIVDINELFEKMSSDASKRLVKQLKGLIDENIGNPELNVKFLARQTNYNSSYIGRTFSMQESLSIKEYIGKKRIDAACKLLASTDLSVFEISTQVGYNDLSTFYEIFKRVKVITPKEYRQSQLKIKT